MINKCNKKSPFPLLRLRETHNALLLPVFYLLFLYQPCPKCWSQLYLGFSDLFIAWKVLFVVTFSSHQKMDLPILEKKLSLRPGLSLKKQLFLVLCSPVQKLTKPSVSSLLTTNYSFVYCIYLFYLSIYLTITLVVGASYQRVTCLTKSYSWSLETQFEGTSF